jgi:lipoic acid synthetase
MRRLREAGCEILTIGQYLQPKREKLDVVEYIHPAVFEEYRAIGEELGFASVFSGPFVRSSYMADLVAHESKRA